jgi:hypothetical protein
VKGYIPDPDMRARGGRAVDKIGSGLLARRCAEVGAIDYRANGLRREKIIYWSKPDARETVNQATLDSNSRLDSL